MTGLGDIPPPIFDGGGEGGEFAAAGFVVSPPQPPPTSWGGGYMVGTRCSFCYNLGAGNRGIRIGMFGKSAPGGCGNVFYTPPPPPEKSRAYARFGRWRRVFGCAILFFFGFAAAGDSAREPTVEPSAESSAIVSLPEVAAADGSAVGFSYSSWRRDKRLRNGYRSPFAKRGARAQRKTRRRTRTAGTFRRAAVAGLAEGARAALASAAPDAGDIRGALIRGGNRGDDLTFAHWARGRLDSSLQTFAAAAGDSLAAAAAENWSPIRRAEVDIQTPFGERRGHIGFSLLGALREKKDSALGWQFRVFTGDGGKEGGNIGFFARAAKNNALWGANAFLDFQREEGGGFWRGGLGAEWRSRFGDIYINRYFPFTGARSLAGGDLLYSRAGLDAQAALNVPGVEWASLSGRYYRWRGRFGQSDESGRALGLRFRPGHGLEFDVYAETGGSGRWGADLRYTKILSDAAFAGAQRPPEFDPRAHFFDAVRREYGQRISRVRRDGVLRAVFFGGSFAVHTQSTVVLRSGAAAANSDLDLDSAAQLRSVLPQQGAIARAAITLTLSVRTTVFLTAASGDFASILLLPPESPSGTIWLRAGGETTLGFVGGGGEKIGFTLFGGALALSLRARHTAYLTADIAPRGAQMPVYGAALATVACALPALPALWDLRAHCLLYGGGFTLVPALRAAFAGTVSLRDNASALVSPAHFALASAGDFALVSLTATTFAATLLTATVAAAGDLLFPSSVFFTVSVAPELALRLAAENLSATVTTRIVAAADLARFAAEDGIAPFVFSPVSSLPSEISLAAGGLLRLQNAVASPRAVSVTVAARDSQIPAARGTIAVTVVFADPPDIALNIARGQNLIVAGHTLTAATVAASGGYLTSGGDYAYRLESGGVFAAAGINADGIVTVSAGAGAGRITATVLADDNHLNTEAATVFLTVRIIDSFALGAGDISATITTRIINAATLARFAALGGVLPYGYSALSNLPAGISLAAGGLLLLTSGMDNALTVSVTVAANDSQTPAPARATAAVTIVFADPPGVLLNIARGRDFVVAGKTLTAATVAASGGYLNSGGDYSYRLESGGVFAATEVNADGIVAVSAGAVAGTITATVIADDNHANTSPATVLLTVRIIDSFAFGVSDISATITTRIINAATLARFVAGGGILPYEYSAVSALPVGVSLAEGGLLLLTSAFVSPLTVSVTVSANDSQNPPDRGTVAVTIFFADPPPVTIDINRGGTLVTAGATLTAATVSVSGGYLTSGGDYSYILESGGVSAIAEVNAEAIVVVSAGTVAGTLTATVIADDNHLNTEAATVLLTVRVIDSFAFGASDISATITTRIIGTATLARFAAAGGILPYDYSAVSGLPEGVSLAEGGLLFLTSAFVSPLTVSVTVSASDSQNPPDRGTVAVTIFFADPPPVTIDINRGGTLVTAGATLTAATVSVSGGYLTSGGDYSYILESGGVSAIAEVNAEAIVIVSAGTVAGMLTATVIADDNHLNTEAATVLLTVRIIDSFVFGAGDINATITTRIVNTATLARFAAAGGIAPYEYSAVSGLPTGVSLAEGGLLLLTSAADTPLTVSVTVSANDSQNPPDRATAAVTIFFADPPSLTIDISRGATLVTAGATLTAATISVSGGYLEEGGAYSYRLDSGGALAAADIDSLGVVTVSAAAEELITATVVVDDNHPNTPAATAFLTARVIHSFALAAGNVRATVTTQIINSATLARFAAAGGIAPYGYSAVSGLPAGISLAEGGLLFLTLAFVSPLTVSVTASANDSQAPPDRATAAVTIFFADPPALTLSINRGADLIIAGQTLTAATVSVSGGFLSEGSGYSYRLESGGVSAIAGINANGGVAISAGTVLGLLTVTILADDDHPNTIPAMAFLTASVFQPLSVGHTTLTFTQGVDAGTVRAMVPHRGDATMIVYQQQVCPTGMTCTFFASYLGFVGTPSEEGEFVSYLLYNNFLRASVVATVLPPLPPVSVSVFVFNSVAANAPAPTLAATVSVGGGVLNPGSEHILATRTPGFSLSGVSLFVSVRKTGEHMATVFADDDSPHTQPATAVFVVTASAYSPLVALGNVSVTLTAGVRLPPSQSVGHLQFSGGLPLSVRGRISGGNPDLIVVLASDTNCFFYVNDASFDPLETLVCATAPDIVFHGAAPARGAFSIVASVYDRSSGGATVEVTVFATIFPPLPITTWLSITTEAFAGISTQLGTVGARGGVIRLPVGGDGIMRDQFNYRHQISAPPGINLFVDVNGAVVFTIADPQTITARIVTDDHSRRTSPATLFFTISVSDYTTLLVTGQTHNLTLTEGVAFAGTLSNSFRHGGGKSPVRAMNLFTNCPAGLECEFISKAGVFAVSGTANFGGELVALTATSLLELTDSAPEEQRSTATATVFVVANATVSVGFATITLTEGFPAVEGGGEATVDIPRIGGVPEGFNYGAAECQAPGLNCATGNPRNAEFFKRAWVRYSGAPTMPGTFVRTVGMKFNSPEGRFTLEAGAVFVVEPIAPIAPGFHFFNLFPKARTQGMLGTISVSGGYLRPGNSYSVAFLPLGTVISEVLDLYDLFPFLPPGDPLPFWTLLTVFSHFALSNNTVLFSLARITTMPVTVIADDDYLGTPPATVIVTMNALDYAPFWAGTLDIIVTTGISLTVATRYYIPQGGELALSVSVSDTNHVCLFDIDQLLPLIFHYPENPYIVLDGLVDFPQHCWWDFTFFLGGSRASPLMGRFSIGVVRPPGGGRAIKSLNSQTTTITATPPTATITPPPPTTVTPPKTAAATTTLTTKAPVPATIPQPSPATTTTTATITPPPPKTITQPPKAVTQPPTPPAIQKQRNRKTTPPRPHRYAKPGRRLRN